MVMSARFEARKVDAKLRQGNGIYQAIFVLGICTWSASWC